MSVRASFSYNVRMTRAWQLQPDGSYKRLSSTEDLITDLTSTLEDVNESFQAFRQVALISMEIRAQSRLLVQRTQRERRLRNSTLRLVRA